MSEGSIRDILISEGIQPNSFAEKVYKHLMRRGYEHTEALKQALLLRGVSCSGMDEETLKALRSALFSVPGQWF